MYSVGETSLSSTTSVLRRFQISEAHTRYNAETPTNAFVFLIQVVYNTQPPQFLRPEKADVTVLLMSPESSFFRCPESCFLVSRVNRNFIVR